jgi:hypothetical protein
MNRLTNTVLITALGLLAGGCSVMQTTPVAREELRNAQGHVVGTKEIMRDARTGEELAQIALFVPRINKQGEIVGYEERVRGGTVLRDLNGKRIGSRWVDVRSRGSNPQSSGLLIVVLGKSERASFAPAPEIDQLIQLARLSN